MTLHKTISQYLAEFSCGLEWPGVPATVQDKIQMHVADTLGVMLAGSTYPASRVVLAGAFGQNGAGCSGATVVGMKTRAPALIAALVNGTSAHGLELDDGCNGVHPGAPIVASALAAAELSGAGGKELLSGVVAGYEVAIRINLAMFPDHRRQGYHPTGTCATFGAAAASGKVLGLDPAKLANALGLAGTQAAGLREGSGEGSAMMKRLHAGKAAENGLLAALLAKQGYLAPQSIFEGQSGFLKVHSPRYDVGVITAELGTRFHLERCYLKPYACCRHIHGPIDSVLALRSKHGLVPEDVERIVVRIYREGTYFSDRDPKGFYDAQFSIPYVVAVALADGEVTLEQFTLEKLSDARIRRLCRKVDVVFDEGLDDLYKETKSRAHVVEVFLASGEVLSASAPHPKGSPENPLSPEEVQEKFMRMAGPVLGRERAREAFVLLGELPRLKSLAGICQILGAF